MDCDDGLAGARPAGQPKRTVEIVVDVFALFGVQKDPPGREVAAFDDSAQFLVVLDVGELHFGGRPFQRLDDLLVFVEVVVGGVFGEAVLVSNVVDSDAGGQVEQRASLPLDSALGGFDKPRFVGRGHRFRGNRSGDSEPVGEVFDGVAD